MTDKNTIQKTLIDELNLSDLPQDKQDALLIRMTEVILKRIFVETMDKLSEKDQEAYSKMIEEKATPEDLDKFLNEKISGYNEMVKKVAEEFKEEMLKQ